MDELGLLEKLVACRSTSGQEGDYARLAAEVLRELGFQAELREVAPGRPNVVARDGSTKLRVVFSTHLDTVPPHIPPTRKGDRLEGRGACDAKGPFVSMVEAARRLKEKGATGIGFLLLVSEEVDHLGALVAGRDYQDLAKDQPRILLGEPTCAKVVLAQKGLLKVALRAHGKAGHSAFPDRGVSAVHGLLDALEKIRKEPWPTDPELGPTTINVGTIAGGVAANVFAPAAEAVLVFRLVSPWKPVLDRVRELCQGVEVEAASQNDPVRFKVPAGEPTSLVPFNTDATYIAPLGPVWLGGPGAIEVAHSVDEHTTKDELAAGTDLYLRLAERALA
ncbi:MAG TPA: M20/M25/M40 family metallo-hydrolase [Planctomycetota bacterium]|nr:M20/M25/M40 family metallo-hydrolase [Planctomycetota bacterium]